MARSLRHWFPLLVRLAQRLGRTPSYGGAGRLCKGGVQMRATTYVDQPAAHQQEESKIKIRVDDLVKRFSVQRRTVLAVDGVSLSVTAGEFVCLVGPSGCGKTTILRILGNLERPSSGSVRMRHEDSERALQAMVFQEQSIFPWWTVRRNIEYGLYLRRVPAAERKRVVEHYLDLVGLAPFAEAYPHQLSGGMKQRVSVARAFATDPEVLLMDEPFAALDEQTKLILEQELLRIWEGSRKTVVYVTHSIDEAIHLADRIIVLTAAPARVKRVIEVPIPRPRDLAMIRRQSSYAETYDAVWSSLRDEVLRQRLTGAPAHPSSGGGVPR